MNLFRGFLILAWLLLMAVTFHAINTLGLEGGKVFFDDFAQAWRAQFYTDFLLHVLPITAWVFWREPSKIAGLLCAVGTTFGGVFTLLYLLIATFREQGDIRRVLLGRHYTS
jgi:peptidoglycan biosynthesis protein MviN/MurJ (putative lipid II flippase)